MLRLIAAALPLALLWPTAALAAPADGFFVAQQRCPAFQSIRNQTNPGNISVDPGRAYEIVEVNRTDAPTHYRLIVPGVSPKERWVSLDCGIRTVADGSGAASPKPKPGPLVVNPVPTEPSDWNVLAASWQPAFCETNGAWTDNNELKPECATQTPDRFDGKHFALHGLWPQPFDPSSEYCGFTATEITALKARNWPTGATIDVDAETRAALATAMPGTMSALEFHEWFKHGTCYGTSQDTYFDDSLLLLEKLNATGIDEYFVAHIGQRVSNEDIREQFDQAFGEGAGSRVGIGCTRERDGNRVILTELRIHLRGEVTPGATFADLIRAGDIATDDSCRNDMVIDAVGL